MVTDRDSPSRYCSESDNEIENEAYVDRDRYYYQVTEPRIEIARSEVVAERLRPTIIEYHPPSPPPPPILSIANNIDCSMMSTTCVGPESASNSFSSKEENGKSNLDSTSSSSPENGGDEEAKNDTVIESNVYFESRMKRIAEMINRISARVGSSTKTIVYSLPCSNAETSTKYNLDPAYMSLMYSLTPTEEINEATIQLGNKQDNADQSTDDFVWFDSLYNHEQTNVPKQVSTPIVNREVLFDSEIQSNEGSDILELSNSTVLELIETNDEEFENNITDKANEIIAELNINDVNDVFEEPASTIAANLEFTDIQAKDELYPSQISIIDSSLPINNHSRGKKDDGSPPPSIFVINELIHHVVDECVELRQISRTEKEMKDDTNAELKGGERQNSMADDEEEETYDSTMGMMMYESDEKKSCRTGEYSPTVVPFERSIEKEIGAIFEFHTMGKELMMRTTNDSNEMYELSFRVEKSCNVPSIIQIERSCEETAKNIILVRSEDYAKQDTNLNNFSSSETDLTKRCNTVISGPEPFEICVECIHCTNTTNDDPEYSYLSPIKEAVNDPETEWNLTSDGSEDSKQVEDKQNATYTCSDSNGSESDKESFDLVVV